jgi:hypothetical protein
LKKLKILEGSGFVTDMFFGKNIIHYKNTNGHRIVVFTAVLEITDK